MIERVVVDADLLEQAAVDESPLKARTRLIQHVGKNVGGISRGWILRGAGSLPLQHHDHAADWLLYDNGGVFRERRNRGYRVSLERFGTALPIAEHGLREREGF